jgi:hypothetical protein
LELLLRSGAILHRWLLGCGAGLYISTSESIPDPKASMKVTKRKVKWNEMHSRVWDLGRRWKCLKGRRIA